MEHKTRILTTNDMCCRPQTISISCLPTASGCGQFESSSFRISLSSTIRFTSSNTCSETNTTASQQNRTVALFFKVAWFVSRIFLKVSTKFCAHSKCYELPWVNNYSSLGSSFRTLLCSKTRFSSSLRRVECPHGKPPFLDVSRPIPSMTRFFTSANQ